MFPKNHIIINFFVSLPLFFLLKVEYVLIFFFASILIDFDHYLYYIIEEKDLSLKRAYNWFKINRAKLIKLPREERRKHAKGILIFHGLEPIFLLAILSYFYYPLLFLSLGFFIHIIEDEIEDIPLGIMKRKLSVTYQIYDHFKKEKK